MYAGDLWIWSFNSSATRPLHPEPRADVISLQLFASSDLSVFLIDLLSAGDSVYSRENLFEILDTPVKTCLICMGTPVKTCWKFWQS